QCRQCCGFLRSRRAEQCVQRRLPEAAERAEGLRDGGRFVSAVDHAVLTTGVAARAAVVVPLRRVEQLAETANVAFLQQIARFLPAEDVVRRVAPRSAFEIPLP